MTSKPVALLLADLGVTKSHSRPHVSNDNPFSESQFKTLKYRPDFPDRFGSLEHGRSFCGDFFPWYNTEHHHVGLGLFTPHDVHYGLAEAKRQQRARVLAEAFAKNPERFPNGLPQPKPVPSAVWINPPAMRADGLQVENAMARESKPVAILAPLGALMGQVYRACDRVRAVRQIAALTVALVTLSARGVAAQLPVPSLRLATGFGVDTTSSPAREVFDLWRRYLVESSDSVRAGLWSQPERATWHPFDLVAPYVYQGFSDYTVVRLAPAVGLSDTYQITTLVSAVDESTHAVRPLALYRVYATIEAGRWVLANALPRMTRTWRRETIGAIHFVFPSTHAFDPRRARATAAFVDSLAAAFGRPAPQPISYYFTTDLEETFRALGLEFFPIGPDTIGGRSNTSVRHVYVGSSSKGEAYRHELAHVILAPEVGRRTAPLLAEGLMTWAGGSAGLDYPQLLPGLARYLVAHPALSLEAVMEDPPPRLGSLDVGYAGLAVLCDLVHRSRGLAGLRAVLKAWRTPTEVLDTAARQLGISRRSLNSLWRATILEHQR